MWDADVFYGTLTTRLHSSLWLCSLNIFILLGDKGAKMILIPLIGLHIFSGSSAPSLSPTQLITFNVICLKCLQFGEALRNIYLSETYQRLFFLEKGS